MISSAKFDKRLITQAIQRGELSTEEVETHLANLTDLSSQAVPALKVKRSSEERTGQKATQEGEGEKGTSSAEAES